MATSKHQVTTYLDTPIYEALKRLAQSEQRSVSQFVAAQIAVIVAPKTQRGRK